MGLKIEWVKKNKPLNEMDENELAIKWADLLIINSNHLGIVNNKSLVPTDFLKPQDLLDFNNNGEGLLRTEAFNRMIIDVNDVNKQTRDLAEHLTRVKNHLLSHRYIEEPKVTETFWRLTEKGELMKELKGHENYQTYRRSEINIIRNQGRTNNLLILATALAAIMPFMAIWLFPPKIDNYNTVPEQVFRPYIQIDSVWLHQQVDDLIQKKLSIQKQPITIEPQLPK